MAKLAGYEPRRAMDSGVKVEEVGEVKEVLLNHPLQAQLGPCSGPAVPCTGWSGT